MKTTMIDTHVLNRGGKGFAAQPTLCNWFCLRMGRRVGAVRGGLAYRYLFLCRRFRLERCVGLSERAVGRWVAEGVCALV